MVAQKNLSSAGFNILEVTVSVPQCLVFAAWSVASSVFQMSKLRCYLYIPLHTTGRRVGALKSERGLRVTGSREGSGLPGVSVRQRLNVWKKKRKKVWGLQHKGWGEKTINTEKKAAKTDDPSEGKDIKDRRRSTPDEVSRPRWLTENVMVVFAGKKNKYRALWCCRPELWPLNTHTAPTPPHILVIERERDRREKEAWTAPTTSRKKKKQRPGLECSSYISI